jgi:hypothetical protein
MIEQKVSASHPESDGHDELRTSNYEVRVR